MLSTGMLKKPWIWSACRSIVSRRSTPTASSMLATTLARDRHARRARPAVLAGVAEIRDHGGHPACRRALERVDHDAELHQVLVGRRARRLDDEDVARAHVLLDLDVDLAVGEAPDLGLAETDRQVRGDVQRQRRIRIACEENGIEEHDNSEGAAIQRIWQGRKDSNLRMSESKSDALTSLATPLHRSAARAAHLNTFTACASTPRPRGGPRRRAGGAATSGTSGPTSPRANRSASLPRAPSLGLPRRRPRFPSRSCGCCRTTGAGRPTRFRPRDKDSRRRPAGRCVRSPGRVPARFPESRPARLASSKRLRKSPRF